MKWNPSFWDHAKARRRARHCERSEAIQKMNALSPTPLPQAEERLDSATPLPATLRFAQNDGFLLRGFA